MNYLTINVTERLTTDPDYDESPIWTPDGSAMIYRGRDGGKQAVLRLAIGRGTQPEKLLVNEAARSASRLPIDAF